jgi:hypothetical protein
VAIDRFAEKERARDAKFRKQSADKVLRSDAKPLTDDELLAKLRSFDIELDRLSLERLCRQALSAEEIATPLLDRRTFRGRQAEMESDWIWVCLTALWQRWFPDQPCFELLDDKIEAGYDLQGSAACRIWLEAWKDVLGLLDKGELTSIRAFDERFRGSQSLFNWIQDLEDALWNAGLEDRQFLTARIAVCEEGLRRFPAEDELMTENRQRAEQILREGLAVEQVRDRRDMLERLAEVCEEQGRKGEATELRKEAKRSGVATRITKPKIGRNERCPCGSGKKYKKCCGA